MEGGKEGEKGRERGHVEEEGCRLSSGKGLQQEVVYLEIYSLDFSSPRKMYVLKFPLVETQSKISQSLNGRTICCLDYSSLGLFLKLLNYN